MTALEIISEIEHLPTEEQAKVLSYANSLSNRWKLTGTQLSEMASKLPFESDLAKADKLKEEIERGFYGLPSRA
jgi:hypothetical protein